jgi:hypothetical protein
MRMRPSTSGLVSAWLLAILLAMPTATAADDARDQGDPGLVLTVDDPAVDCEAVPGVKVERGSLGRHAEVRSPDPIDRVTVKSGEGARVVRSETGLVGGMYRLAFELSKDIGSYVAWTCPAGVAPSPRPGPTGEALAPREPVASPPPTGVIGDDLDDIEALAARFPSVVAGHPVAISAFGAEEWLTAVAPDDAAAAAALEALALAAGLALDEIAIVTGLIEPGPGDQATVAAVGLPGTDARALTNEVIALLLGDIETSRIVPESIAGKVVLRVTDAAYPGTYPAHLYADGDVMWLIEADEPLRSEILRGLP